MILDTLYNNRNGVNRMWKSWLTDIRYADASKPCYFVDLQIKNFDHLCFHDTNNTANLLQQQLFTNLKALPYPPLAVLFQSCDHFLCLYQAKNKENLMNKIAALDDMLYLISYNIASQPLFLGIGIYESQPDEDMFNCMQKARLARTLSKDAQKFHTHIEWYQDAYLSELQKKHQLEQLIYQTIGLNSFQMLIQPKISCAQSCVCGGEALIRFPFLDGRSTDTFHMITLAEHNGLIEDLDLSMFEKVCKYQTETIRRHETLLPISVNISRTHFQSPRFFQAYLQIYRRYQLPAFCIELEITESAQLQPEDKSMTAFLQQAHQAGFHVSLDDFGSGQSSLGLLGTMQFDSIKLDRSFFLHDTRESRLIITAMLQLAHALAISTIAEGIETAAQVQFLKEHHCTAIQGFYYAPPLQEEAFRTFVSQFSE